MSTRNCIRNIPTEYETMVATDRLRLRGYRLRRRGRGPRGSSIHRHMELPMREAPRFSLYVEPAGRDAVYRPIQQWEYVGLTESGKLRVRVAS